MPRRAFRSPPDQPLALSFYDRPKELTKTLFWAHLTNHSRFPSMIDPKN